MKLTTALKAFAVASLSVAADASDDVFKKSISDAIMDGRLDAAKMLDLSKSEPTGAEAKVQSMIDSSISKAIGPVLDAIKGLAVQSPAAPAVASPAQKTMAAAAAAGVDGSNTENHIRVKSVVEQFNDSRTAATWDKSTNVHLAKAFAGRQIGSFTEGLPYSLDMPTERQKAIAGAWFKHMILKSMRSQGKAIPAAFQMKEIDHQLVQYALHECRFVGEMTDGYEYSGEKLYGDLHRKAVLDDSTSGGLEAVPIEFDAAAILTPLLNGEVFPYVNITNVTRRRIEATKIGNPTMSWGTSEGTEVPLFDTDSLISAFDNTIYPLTGAMEMGLDFLADSPLAAGQILIQRYGEKFRQVMDNVIVTGTGTNQPEGVFNASGVGTVTPAGGAGAAPQVGDYEGLMFGVAKEYRQEAGNPPNSRAMFIGTDTTYSRARGIPVDSSNDARRIFGMDEMSYQLFGYRYAINQSLTNAKFGFFCMNRYRLYRRQGFEVKVVTDDWGLVRANKQGVVVRARFGGSLETSSAGSKITAGQV